MIVVIKRDGVVCNMDFGPEMVAIGGKFTKLNPHKSWKRIYNARAVNRD